MAKSVWAFAVIGALLWLIGCSALQLTYETPTVNVTSFRLLPSDGGGPRFEIGLHVVNPNRSALNLRGLSYTVSLEGHRVLTGVATDLPVIEGYSEGEVLLRASADLLNSIRLFADILKDPRDSFSYELAAKLDIGGFRPNIHVEKKGEISLPRSLR